ncbi:heme exporter protein CcmD [Albimonas donghaensis]|uniref:Heme exporter protein D n=1 Tax=Albimonas donghaensis TaxID=356660 RepID=A0A1H2Z9Z2_9RHOB|nr:heme exporter protein CcmD [Albimonas donghaensis]MAS42182.1 heme exporter protein CcmD [Paracoccaceae bacterium]MBR28636.1 heme exporter protein CcmD [Paracoccaceae bacterium]SDX14135.1 heme exporter protein CcmD [Albimonas donghaensis]
MPDLGDYAAYVLVSYAAALVVLGAVILWSLRAAARAKAELERLESRHGRRRSVAPVSHPEEPPR